MLNRFALVGRLLEIKDNSIVIESGTDKLAIKVSSNLFEKIQNYCKIGGVIGIKGKISSNDIPLLVADIITFLSTKKSAN